MKTEDALKQVEAGTDELIAWLLTRSAADLSADETALISQLKTTCPEIVVARNLALRFVAMARERQGNKLDAWIAAATAADSPRDLQGLARGFQADLAAVRAALELP